MDSQDISSWKKSFFKNSFTVDQCLSDYTQKSDLETLRRDLKNYGAELQMHMADILKNETEAIVNLAEYLTNLNSKIDNLSVPISQLREEIKTLYDLIHSSEESYETMLTDIKSNNSKQNHVHLKLGILNSSVYINNVINSLEGDILNHLLTLERIVNKYSFQKMYLDELNLMTHDIEKVVNVVEVKLVDKINNCFLKAVKDQNEDIILRCLRMYVNLQKHDEVYKTFRKYILAPQLQPLLTEQNLEKCNHDLSKVYSNVTNILDNEVGVILGIVNNNPDLKGFNFVVNSFWKEFDNQAREGLPHITAPGNPELFQKRFSATFELLKYISAKAGNKNLVKQDESFQNHLKRFNLLVYFEIKFQQIAGDFESNTFNLNWSNIVAGQNKHSFRLKPSLVMWNAVMSCFHNDVYIDQLADYFIRLVMMIISRYLQVMEKLLENIGDSIENKDKFDNFIIDALSDLETINSLVAPKCENTTEVEKTVFVVVNPNMWPLLMKIFKANQAAVLKILELYKVHIINSKVKDCLAQMQNVTAIPRLYRKTNRSPPKEASVYMVEALKPILSFESKFQAHLDQHINDIFNNIIIQVTNQYLVLVQEVLKSVRKTEESLKRLKSRALNTSGDDLAHGPAETMSDETKIREQIKYDVGYFFDKLYPLAEQPTRNAIDLLKKEVCM